MPKVRDNKLIKDTLAKYYKGYLAHELHDSRFDMEYDMLEEAINKSKEDLPLILADAQFTGFNKGAIDGRIDDLAKEMGLTELEWHQWKTKCSNGSLDQKYQDELDTYFFGETFED